MTMVAVMVNKGAQKIFVASVIVVVVAEAVVVSMIATVAVSYTHLTLTTTAYV